VSNAKQMNREKLQTSLPEAQEGMQSVAKRGIQSFSKYSAFHCEVFCRSLFYVAASSTLIDDETEFCARAIESLEVRRSECW
jgi:hypothetical protein